jgi:type III secretion system chaperone SycN
MSIADTAIRDFGGTMGLPELAFNEHGVVRLRFESSGSLSIERTPTGCLIRLAKPLDQHRDGIVERALELCHFDHVDRLRPEVGLSQDGSLVFSVRIDENALDVSTLEESFELLRRLHERTAG